MDFAFEFDCASSSPSGGSSALEKTTLIELVDLYEAQPAAPALPALVVEGVYEGGAQVWEATTFLLAFLRDERSGGGRALSSARCVADLGCGAGQLACAALEARAPGGGGGGGSGGSAVSALLLTDLNAQVLRSVAAPAVRAVLARQAQRWEAASASAAPSSPPLVRVELVAGSWAAMLSSLSSPLAGH